MRAPVNDVAATLNPVRNLRRLETRVARINRLIGLPDVAVWQYQEAPGPL